MKVPAPVVRSANTEQYYSSPLVNIANSVIQYKIHSSVSSLTTEITGAIGMWNASGAYVVLQLVSSGEDVLITADDLPPNVCGAAYLPSGGLPGNTVFLDLALLATKTSTQVKALIAHEIGHTIGFGHTDDGTGYTAVPGYSGGDGSSIMIQYICGSGNTALSTNDIGSVNVLYRNPFPSTPWIDLSYNEFTIRWTPALPIYNDTFLHYLVEYGGQSGTGFSGSVQLTPSGSNSYVIPGAMPEPSPSADNGYIHATVKAVYSSATCALTSVSKYKSGGVWY